MGYVISIVLTIAGWKLMQTLKLPASALLGPMMFVGTARILGIGMPPIPPVVTGLLQIILGIFVGIRIDREKLDFLRSGMAVPTAVVVVWTIGSALIAAFVLLRLTDLDLSTILFGATPGGIAEMSIISITYGADVAIVSLLQFLRLVMVVVLIPAIALRLQGEAKDETAAAEEKQLKEQKQHKTAAMIIVGSGLVMGVIFMKLGFPAGGIIGGLIGVGAANIILNRKANIPSLSLRIAQMGIGLVIGLQFRPDTIQTFLQLMVPATIFSIFMVVSGILLALLIKLLTNWDLPTCLICSAPAGISQMILVAADLKADLIKVTYFHLIRILTIYLIINQMYQWYLNSI